jgi:hypothetical protein
VHEIKLDGWRIQIRVENGTATLRTRNGHDYSRTFPELARIARGFENCIIDGEVCSVRKDGITDFSDLQAAMKAGKTAGLVFFAFDLLFLGVHHEAGNAQGVTRHSRPRPWCASLAAVHATRDDLASPGSCRAVSSACSAHDSGEPVGRTPRPSARTTRLYGIAGAFRTYPLRFLGLSIDGRGRANTLA